MADMTDDQLKRYFQRPDFDSKVLTPDEKTRLVQLTAPASKTPEPAAAKVDDSPMTFAKDFTEGVGGQLKDSFGGILKGFQAVPDVVRNLANPATRDATISGGKEGAVEGARGLKDLVTDPIALATGIGKQPEDTRFGTKVGRLAAGAAMVGVPAALGDRVMNGAPTPEPSILKGAEQFRDVESRGPKVSAPEQAARTPMVHGDVAPTEHFQPRLEMQPFEGRGTTPTLPIDASGPLKTEIPAELLEHQEPVAEKTAGASPATDPKTAAMAEQFKAKAADLMSKVGPPDRNLGSMSPQDHMFESLMEQLHPEEDGPLPGNGEFKGSDPLTQELKHPVGDVEGEQRAGLLDRALVDNNSRNIEQTPNQSQNLGEIRDEVGAQEAARDPRIMAAFKEAGIKPTADAIRDMSGTPLREPLEKSGRLLDNDFMRHVMDERGSIQFGPDWLTKKNKVIAGDPSYTGDVKSMIQSDNIRQGKGSGEDWVNQTVTDRLKALRSNTDGSVTTDFIKSAGRVANQARVSSFLSGLAVPKSLLGNANAIVTAAIENGDFNIVKEAFNLKANAQSLKDAWQSTANPAAISGAGKINVPGRVMGAADQATIDLLKRAGLSEDDAQRLQLQRPNPVGDNNFGKALKSPVGKFVWPFQRTPFNQLAEGISSENWKSPHAGDTAGTARRTGLSLAAGGAGYELGQNTKDPRILGLAAAMAGVRGVPLLIGAAMGGAGKNAIAGISPIPEWGIPSKASDLARLTGLDPAFIKAYGLDDTSKRKDRSSRPTTSRSSR